MMPAEIREITNEDYHSSEGISVSGLKLMARSPLHYWAAYIDPEREQREQSISMMLGSAIHCAVLEPDDFQYRYAVVPDGIDRRSKEGKALFAEIEASGKTPLKPDQYATIRRAADGALAHPFIAQALALPGKVERSIYWVDSETGVLCKMRTDFMIEPCAEWPHGMILDIKSAEDASQTGFIHAAYDYGYHQQAAWYKDGFQQCYGTEQPPEFFFGVVEKTAPFASAVYSASEEQVALGHLLNAELLALYAECRRTNTWPGYSQEISPLALPAWAMKQLNESEEIEVEYV